MIPYCKHTCKHIRKMVSRRIPFPLIAISSQPNTLDARVALHPDGAPLSYVVYWNGMISYVLDLQTKQWFAHSLEEVPFLPPAALKSAIQVSPFALLVVKNHGAVELARQRLRGVYSLEVNFCDGSTVASSAVGKGPPAINVYRR